jgi:hypothetical protein
MNIMIGILTKYNENACPAVGIGGMRAGRTDIAVLRTVVYPEPAH